MIPFISRALLSWRQLCDVLGTCPFIQSGADAVRVLLADYRTLDKMLSGTVVVIFFGGEANYSNNSNYHSEFSAEKHPGFFRKMQNSVYHFFFQNPLHGLAVGQHFEEGSARQRAEVVQNIIKVSNGRRILIV